jgi:D-inositol-3-phosphate glycosyltransferase
VQPLNIAMLSVHTSPLASLGGKEAGGMNVYVRELSRELGERGVRVDIFTRNNRDTASIIEHLAPNVRLISLPAGETILHDKYQLLLHLPEFVQRVVSFAEEQGMSYDLLHSHYWISGEVALRLQQKWRIPIVQMFHTLGAMKKSVARNVEEAEKEQRMAIERRLLQHVDAVVAATPLDRDQMITLYHADPANISVIPCGVNLQRFQPSSRDTARHHLNIPADDHVLLAVGRMEPLKGLDCLIRAAALLYHRHPDWQSRLRVLLIGGAAEGEVEDWNAEQRRLADLRTSLGIPGTVTFLGRQPQDALPIFYAAADVCVMPSHYESFGLVALEAQACAGCVVASNVGGLSSLIDDGRSGLFITPDDHETLASQLECLLNHPSYRQALGSEAHRRAAFFSWTHVADRMMYLYHGLLERKYAVKVPEHLEEFAMCEELVCTLLPVAQMQQRNGSSAASFHACGHVGRCCGWSDTGKDAR